MAKTALTVNKLNGTNTHTATYADLSISANQQKIATLLTKYTGMKLSLESIIELIADINKECSVAIS